MGLSIQIHKVSKNCLNFFIEITKALHKYALFLNELCRAYFSSSGHNYLRSDITNSQKTCY